MGVKNCQACSLQIDRRAQKCPYCRVAQQRVFRIGDFLLGFAGMAVLCAVVALSAEVIPVSSWNETAELAIGGSEDPAIPSSAPADEDGFRFDPEAVVEYWQQLASD